MLLLVTKIKEFQFMGKIYSTKNDSNIYKKARQAIGLTQAEVSQYLHINRSAISKWESGSSIPDPALLPKIAKLYNVTTDYLLGLDNSVFDKNINTNNTILRLKELRLSRGIKTQKEMAKLLGVAYNTYNYWENEQFQLDYKNLIRIADYFNVSIDYLLGRSESSAVVTQNSKLINHPEYELSDKFEKDYAQLLKDTNFIEMTKLFNGITAEYRALSLGYIVGLLQKHGINTQAILGY